jgi:hypothetical protein
MVSLRDQTYEYPIVQGGVQAGVGFGEAERRDVRFDIRWAGGDIGCFRAVAPGQAATFASRGGRVRLWPNRDARACPLLPAIGGRADINSASSDRLGLLGIPVHPASLIRLAGATFMALTSS